MYLYSLNILWKLDIREANGKPALLPLNQRLTWKVRLAKLCLSCLRTLVFCLLLDCIHAHSKCILRMNALLWFLYMLSNFDGKTYIPTKHKYIHKYLLMLYLLILYTHSSISLQINVSYSKYEHPQLLWWKIMCLTVSNWLLWYFGMIGLRISYYYVNKKMAKALQLTIGYV